jgi:hypothetical protein
MTRYLFTLIFTLVFAACGQNTSKQKETTLEKKQVKPEEKEQSRKENPAPGKADTITAPPQPGAAQTSFKDFNAFYESFRKAVGQKNMQTLTDFVNFPFDEQDGLWTKNQFIQSFQLGKDEIQLIRSTMPSRISSNEYRLSGDEAGLSFKKNKAGYWKWFSIYYAE